VQFLNYRLDVYFVNAWQGLQAVGNYTMAVWLTQMLWLLPNAIGALVLQAAARAERPELALPEVCRITRLSVLLSAGGGLALAVVAALFVPPVLGEDFRGAIRPLVLLLPGVVAFTVTILLSAYLNGIRHQHLTTYVACGSLAVTVAADVLLIPRYGIAGAAIASSLSYVTSAVVTALVVRRLVPALALRELLLPRRDDLHEARRMLVDLGARFRRAPRAS